MKKTLLAMFTLITLTKSTPVMTRENLIKETNVKLLCDKVFNLNNYYYVRDTAYNMSGIPADISIHWKTGNVFFTLISEEMKMGLHVLHPTGEIDAIKVAGLGQSSTVDNLNDIVYLATDNGVYKYRDDGSIELYTALGEDVMYIAVNYDGSAMFIATWPQNRVHKISNDGQKTEVYSAIPNGHGLTIDTRNNMYFVATKTSYILKSGNRVPIRITGLPTDKMTGIFVSRSDEVYAMDEISNFYLIDPDNTSAKLLGNFNVTGVNSFGLDSADNVLIGTKGAILKFSAKENDPCPNRKSLKPLQTKSKSGKRHDKKHRKRRPTTTRTTTEAEYDEED